MSRKRKELIQAIEEKLIEKILIELDEEDFTDSNEEQDEDSEIFMLGLLALNEVRYLEPRVYNIAKSQDWYNNILPSYDDIRFKKIMRMFPENFKALINLLATHPIFQSNNIIAVFRNVYNLNVDHFTNRTHNEHKKFCELE